jgi:hypothetical protein
VTRLGPPLAALAALAVGCAGELENPERFATCPPGYVEQLFQQRCAGTCHAGASPEAGLDLSRPDPAAMIGLASTTSFCEGQPLIDPAATDPAAHLLLDKLEDQPGCGARMPFGREALTATERECVRRWVDDALGVSP